jgi:DNA mismatch endonuclease, patch repair protein
MVDAFSPEQRSACMRAVKDRNTGPEMRVRKLAHAMGYRYALHLKRLPGTPDLVLVARRKIIFVHGCFWHKHTCRHGRTSPVTNRDYWKVKRQRNAQRDREHTKLLRAAGWKVLVIWECWTQDSERLRLRLDAFLADTGLGLSVYQGLPPGSSL